MEVNMNKFFPINISGQIITIEKAIATFLDIIAFVNEHFNAAIKRYKVALFVYKSILNSFKGIQDRKPSKEDFKLAVDVLEEILNYNELDEQRKFQNMRNCEICKEIIEKCYR